MLAVYHLPDALPGEKVITVVHRDAFIAVKRVVFFVLLLILPVILLMGIATLFPSLGERVWLWPSLLLAVSAYVFFVWLLFFFSLVDFILDVWIITDQRIIDVRQNGFFSRSVSEVRLSRIQDISSEIHGFWPTILKYGNVIIQTSSESNKLFFEEVAKPEHVRDMIMKLMSDKPALSDRSAA